MARPLLQDEVQESYHNDSDHPMSSDDFDADESLSDGKDIVENLCEALSDDAFNFTGNFCHFSTYPNAPNSGLKIKGVGVVPLPLTDRDAKSIISKFSSRSASRRGGQPVIEVSAAQVSFTNPEWTKYVERLAATTVWASLGAPIWTVKPQCQLNKLVLYRTSSTSLSHQDDPKPNGTFATILIFLPSTSPPGKFEVTLSHAGRKEVFDVAKLSLGLQTSILAWYNNSDVLRELKRLTSGHRLALAYNLIYDAPGEAIPSLPDVKRAVKGLRKVLNKWGEGKYALGPTPTAPYIAYLLKNRYSRRELKRGSECPRGEDAQRVSHLLPIAEELGFSVYLATLKVTRSGQADEEYYRRKRERSRKRKRRSRWHKHWDELEEDDDEYEEAEGGEPTPTMGKPKLENYELSNLVMLCGESQLPFDEFAISDSKAVIPKGAFDGVEPDSYRTEYEDGEMGDHLGTIEQWYERSVLLLFRKADEAAITLDVEGEDWALKILRCSSTTPSSYTQSVASALAAKLEAATKDSVHRPMAAPTISSRITLLRYAVRTEDEESCNRALACCGSTGGMAAMAVGEVLEVFGFDSIRPGIEALLKLTPDLKTRLEMLKVIVDRIETVYFLPPSWVDGLTNCALSSCVDLSPEDVPALIEVVQKRGVTVIQDIILPTFSNHKGTSSFFAALAKGLHHYNQRPDTKATSPEKVIQQCLFTAFEDWSTVVAKPLPQAKPEPVPLQPYPPPPPPNSKVKWICDMVELCLELGDLDSCRTLLFDYVLRIHGDFNIEDMFKDVYTPLVSHLKAAMQKNGKRITDDPFCEFFKTLISTYMAKILRSKLSAPRLQRWEVGCGCADCTQLETFLNNALPTWSLRAKQERREHIELMIRRSKIDLDFVTITTRSSTNPKTLVVEKRPDVSREYTWEGRKEAAIEFLKSVGLDREVKEVMGEIWEDVVGAVTGKRAFELQEV